MEGDPVTKYQLAKLIAMAGTLKSRKRIQKTIHLLKLAGCPIEADYRLHYYGPYSSDVAELLDEMTANGLLKEEAEAVGFGKQYGYSLPENVLRSMREFESTDRGRGAQRAIAPFAGLMESLRREPAKTLEYASTIAHFRQAGREWGDAIEETAKYKKVTPDSLKCARELAQQVLERAHGDD